VRAVNLIPAEDRRGAGGLAGRSGGIVYVLTGGLAVLVALGVLYAFAVHTVAQRKGELASVAQQVAAVNAETQSLQPYVQVAAISAEKVQQVASIAEQRFNWPSAMQQLALALPNDVTFLSLTASAPGVSSSAGSSGSTPSAPTAGSASAAPFALVGCANSQGEIPAVLNDLASVPDVTDVSLESSVENSQIGYHGLPTTLNHGGPVNADAPTAGACPKITWTVSLSYAGSYTVPKVKLPQGSSSGAQTVSDVSGNRSSTIVQTASQRVTP
jgi:Tfp pilus assembly protein PilN